MTDRQELAKQLVVLQALSQVIKRSDDELRVEARSVYKGRMADPVLAGEIELGRVSRNRRREGLYVADWPAFRAWVEEHVPLAMEQKVADWFVRDITKTGIWTDPSTGEVIEVPGLNQSQTDGNLVVEVTEEARRRMQAVLADAQKAIEP